MNNRVRDGMLAVLGLLLAIGILIVGGVSLAVWWLESRFGPEMALTTMGGTLGIFVLLLGISVGIIAYRSGQRNSVQVVQAISNTMREVAKSEGKIGTIEARRIDQMAQERAKLLTVQPTWEVQTETQNNDEIKVWT